MYERSSAVVTFPASDTGYRALLLSPEPPIIGAIVSLDKPRQSREGRHMDLLLILQIIGMMLRTFVNVLVGMTLAMTAGAALYLLWQWWFEKSHLLERRHFPKRA